MLQHKADAATVSRQLWVWELSDHMTANHSYALYTLVVFFFSFNLVGLNENKLTAQEEPLY